MKKIKWGILGCGRIAGKFADDIQLLDDAELIAVGSRTYSNAESFGKKYNVTHIHGSYDELVMNPEVDAIYVASPHAQHHEHTLLCLNNKKAVLCEKAFAINSGQAKDMIDTAKFRNVFLMEALWTRFLPHFNLVKEYVDHGKLGEIKSICINFGFKPTEPIPQRLFDPALGGGSLLDIGIYNIFLTLSLLGRPQSIDAFMTPASTGVDEQCSMVFKYKNGAIAQLISSFATNLGTEADIAGTNGRIRLGHRFYEPSTTIQYYPERFDSMQIIPFEKVQGWGFHYEIKHVNDCLRKGLIESPIMSHADTLLLMEIMDEVRRKAGIHYPADKIA
ncbi:MAG: Gfo/Idh/MocA family protein [Chitinophagaceae bacterium]